MNSEGFTLVDSDAGARFANGLPAGVDAGAGALKLAVGALDVFNALGAGVSFFGAVGLKLNRPDVGAGAVAGAVLLGVAALEAPKSVGVDTLLLEVAEAKLRELEAGAGAVAAKPVDACALVEVPPNMLFCACCDGGSLFGVLDPKLKALFCAGGAVWVDAPDPPNMVLVAGGAV